MSWFKKAATNKEIGVSGLSVYDGTIEEEALKALNTFEKRQLKFKEMAENDWACGAMLFAIKTLILQAEWSVTSFSEDKKHVDDAAWLEDVALKKLNQPFHEVLSNILIMNYTGFMLLEKVYKRLDDGKITWAKLAARKPATIYKWNFDEHGELTGVVQQDPNTLDFYEIPIEKLLLFRPDMELDNPEGKSLVRNSHKSYFRKGKYEFYEAVGYERGSTGFPVVDVPGSVLGDDATDSEKALLTEIKKILRNIRVDQQSGVILPSDVYEGSSEKMFKFRLETPNLANMSYLRAAIKDLSLEILSTILADFIALGQKDVGSFALASEKTSIFAMAVGSILNGVSSVFNEQAIPEVFQLNGDDSGEYPTLKPSDIESDDSSAWAESINKLLMSGAITPDIGLEREARRKVKVLDIDEDAYANLSNPSDEPELEPENVEPEDDEKLKPEDVK